MPNRGTDGPGAAVSKGLSSLWLGDCSAGKEAGRDLGSWNWSAKEPAGCGYQRTLGVLRGQADESRRPEEHKQHVAGC